MENNAIHLMRARTLVISVWVCVGDDVTCREHSWVAIMQQVSPLDLQIQDPLTNLLEICPRGNHISLYSWLIKCSLNIHG